MHAITQPYALAQWFRGTYVDWRKIPVLTGPTLINSHATCIFVSIGEKRTQLLVAVRFLGCHDDGDNIYLLVVIKVTPFPPMAVKRTSFSSRHIFRLLPPLFLHCLFTTSSYPTATQIVNMDSTSGYDANVYIGVWTNWSRGRVMGSTLTLTKSNGNLLIAFTAFFVGFMSSRAWRIVSFCLHRLYSTTEPRDALHHQRQAVLRNSETAGWSFWTLGQIAWAWRRSGPGRHSGCLVMVLPTLLSSVLCIAVFAASSGFSSQISTGIGDEVLIDGSHCGIVQPANNPEDDLVYELQSRRRSEAYNYAQQCYRGPQSTGTENTAAGIFDCNSFVVSSLPGSVDSDALCPFGHGHGICRDMSSNLFLDTGYIDSHEYLGLNAPSDQRILLRETYHCAPLKTDGFSRSFSANGANLTAYNYGPMIDFLDPMDPANFTTPNHTLVVPSIDSQYSFRPVNSTSGIGNSAFKLRYVNNTYQRVAHVDIILIHKKILVCSKSTRLERGLVSPLMGSYLFRNCKGLTATYNLSSLLGME